MKKIRKFAVLGVSTAAFALVSAALAVGAASAASQQTYRAGSSAGAASGVPNTNIKGKPAHFSPTSLSAKARWTSATCASRQFSFTMSNHENATEVVSFTGTNGFTPFTVFVAPQAKEGVCITKGYHGTLRGKLGRKKLTVTF